MPEQQKQQQQQLYLLYGVEVRVVVRWGMPEQQKQQQQQLYLLYGVEVRVVEVGNARTTKTTTTAIPPLWG